jgi:uncharacterized protein (DUF433 family)
MGGVPCIRGLRVTVSMVLGQLAASRTPDEILGDYPYLELADITAALEFAVAIVNERERCSRLPTLRSSTGLPKAEMSWSPPTATFLVAARHEGQRQTVRDLAAPPRRAVVARASGPPGRQPRSGTGRSGGGSGRVAESHQGNLQHAWRLFSPPRTTARRDAG